MLSPSLRDLVNARAADVAIVDANGDQITTFTSVVTPPSTATITSVASSAVSVTLLAANADRRRVVINNESTKKLYIAFAATATATAYTYTVAPQQVWDGVLNDYTGDISGIWAAANGFARITEVTV